MPAGRLYPGMTGRRLLPTLLGLVLVALLALLRLGDPLPVSAIRDMGFDFEQRLLPRPAHDSPVRVVDIDEASLSRFGQWPWPRDILAKLTDRLAELGAAAIGYDVLFPEADRLSADNDKAFAASLSKANAVLGFSLAPNAPPLGIDPASGNGLTYGELFDLMVSNGTLSHCGTADAIRAARRLARSALRRHSPLSM